MKNSYHAEDRFPQWMREDPEVRTRVGMAPTRIAPLPPGTAHRILGDLGAAVGRAARALAERWPTPPIPYTFETRRQRFARRVFAARPGRWVRKHVRVSVWWKSWLLGATYNAGWLSIRLGPVTIEADFYREPWQ